MICPIQPEMYQTNNNEAMQCQKVTQCQQTIETDIIDMLSSGIIAIRIYYYRGKKKDFTHTSHI